MIEPDWLATLATLPRMVPHRGTIRGRQSEYVTAQNKLGAQNRRNSNTKISFAYYDVRIILAYVHPVGIL